MPVSLQIIVPEYPQQLINHVFTDGVHVVLLSDLNFTTKWLEPKITFPCTLANLLHRSYSAESKMKDGTTWKLTCTRYPGDTTADSAYEFSVTTPDCLVFE
jgi:hypothetical protein